MNTDNATFYSILGSFQKDKLRAELRAARLEVKLVRMQLAAIKQKESSAFTKANVQAFLQASK